MSIKSIENQVGKTALMYLRIRDEELNALKAENKQLKAQIRLYRMGGGPVGATGPTGPPRDIHDTY